MGNELRKEERKTKAELEKQWYIMYGCAVMVLEERYHWRGERVKRFAYACSEVWLEVKTGNRNIFEICEDETKMILGMPGEKEWRDLDVFPKGEISEPKRIYTLQMQRKWIPTMLMACFCIALHRYKGWGNKTRLPEFVDLMNKSRKWNREPETYERLCEANYGIELLMKE